MYIDNIGSPGTEPVPPNADPGGPYEAMASTNELTLDATNSRDPDGLNGEDDPLVPTWSESFTSGFSRDLLGGANRGILGI